MRAAGSGTEAGAAEFPQELLDRAAAVTMAVFDVDGVLTDGRLFLGEDGNELRAFHVRDGQGLVMLRESGCRIAIISARSSQVLERRMKSLGIEDLFQGEEDKGECLQGLMRRHSLRPAQVCYVGDDVVDLPALRHAGLKIAVADAAADVLSRVDWVTGRPGGAGAVREVCECLLRATGRHDAALRKYLD